MLINNLSRFSDVFYVDASTKETISAGLINIALANGIRESEEATLAWLSRQRKTWLLVFDNADDPTINLRPYLPSCAHGNILITSRNRDTCVYAPQFCKVSYMRPEDARDLLLNVARHEHNDKNETLATTIVKVHLLCFSGRSYNNYCAGTRTPGPRCGPSWRVYLQVWMRHRRISSIIPNISWRPSREIPSL